MDEYEITEEMLEKIKQAVNRLPLSYHGSNCRTCNSRPSRLRKFYWRLEDLRWRILKWYYKEPPITLTLEDLFKGEDYENRKTG